MTHDLRGCIFGLDGVLVDTARYHMEAWHWLAEAMDFHLPDDARETLRHLSRMACIEQILLWNGGQYMTEAEKMFWTDIKNNWYIERVAHMKAGEVLPGVVYFLRELRGAGIKTAIASASQNARSVLKSTQIEPYFDAIVDGQQDKKGKSGSDGFLMAAEALGLAPQECVVFEDSPNGIASAVRSGFWVVGVGNDPHLLEAAHASVAGFENLSLERLFRMEPIDI